MTLAWSSLDALRQFRKYRLRTKPDFLIHDYGMEFLGYIGTIQKKTKWNANRLWFSDPWRCHGIPWIQLDNSKKNEMEYEQHQNLGSINLAWGSLDTSREYKKRRNGIWTASEFRIHYFGMEPLAYIERIKKNRKGIGKHLNLRSITLAWSPLDAFRESRQSGMEYEQNLNLGPITLAWSSLHTLRESRKKTKWNTNKQSEFGIHSFGMEPLAYIERIPKQPNGIRTKYEFGIHYFGKESLGYIKRIQKKWNTYKIWVWDPLLWHGALWIHWENPEKKRNGTWTKSEFRIHYFGMELLRYIEAIHKKNEMEYEQNLNLESITLA